MPTITGARHADLKCEQRAQRYQSPDEGMHNLIWGSLNIAPLLKEVIGTPTTIPVPARSPIPVDLQSRKSRNVLRNPDGRHRRLTAEVREGNRKDRGQNRGKSSASRFGIDVGFSAGGQLPDN
jgi:hypothetical protein